MTTNDLLTIKLAAQEIGVAEITIRREISRGNIKAYRIGRAVRIKRSDLHKAMKPIKTYADYLR